MFEWAAPLWFLALPLAALAPWLSRRPRIAAAPRAGLPALLGSIGLILLVVALARPQLVEMERVVQRPGIDIVMVLDTSGSMKAQDYSLSGRRVDRLEIAKEVGARFIDGRPDDRIGLVIFGEEARTGVPLTLDHDAMKRYLEIVQIGMIGERATAVGDALSIATRRLAELEAPSRVVVLLTDGRSNAGDVSPMEAAEAAQALGVRVYTVGVGGSGGGGGGLFGMFSGARSDLDERTLKAIADTTGGRYFRAADTKTLEAVYATIDELEKSTAEVEEIANPTERFEPYAIVGLLMLLLQLLLGETVLRRLP